MKRLFSVKNLLIALYIAVAFSGGLALGLKMGYADGAQNITEIGNQMLGIKPYDASLQIKDLEYSDILSSRFTVSFNTNKTTSNVIYVDDINSLVCEWAIYSSDIFAVSPIKLQVFGEQSLRADIETYPEGGTVMFRIVDQKENQGSPWFYINLPRPSDENTILPPPYMPLEEQTIPEWQQQ